MSLQIQHFLFQKNLLHKPLIKTLNSKMHLLLFKTIKMAPDIKDLSMIRKETVMASFITKEEEFMMENGDRIT